jgi:hypothetical protein
MIEQEVGDARALMHAVPGCNQVRLVLIHELCPSLQHQHDVEFGLVLVPASAFFRRFLGPDELRDHAAPGGVGDAEIAVLENARNPSLIQGVSPSFTWANILTIGLSSTGKSPLQEPPPALGSRRGPLRSRPAFWVVLPP